MFASLHQRLTWKILDLHQHRSCCPRLHAQRGCSNKDATRRLRSGIRVFMAAVASQEALSDREAHNRLQADTFNRKAQGFSAPLPAEVSERLRRIVDAVPELGPESRVLDVGAGAGCLVPHLRARGVRDILAVDLAPAMLAQLRELHGADESTLGNEACARTWVGDVESVPPFQGPFDAAFFNAVFGNVFDQHEALLRACLLLRPGGHIVISHPLGRPFHERLRAGEPRLVPHALPDQAALAALAADLPLRARGLIDEDHLYLALLQVPPAFLLQGRPPLLLEGEVVAGFGRGSARMGVPTANIAPEPLAEKIAGLPLGVYFGWAQLEGEPGVHKMALNIGRRPSWGEGADVTVEVHIMRAFAAGFYGRRLRVVVSGFLRPEMRFGGIDELVSRIRADVGVARTQLDLPEHQVCKAHECFVEREAQVDS